MLRLSHAQHDAPIAAWVTDVLARTLPKPWTVEAVPAASAAASSDSLIHLGWRQRHAQAIRDIRAEDGLTSAQPHDVALQRLRAALHATPATASGTRVLFVDDLVADFTTTLRRALTSTLGKEARAAPSSSGAFLTVDTGTMTTEALLLLDAYAAQAAAASSSSPATSAESADALTAVAANMPIEDLYTIVGALLGKRRASQPPPLAMRLAPLALNRSAPHSSRRARKKVLIELLAAHWPLPPSAAGSRGRARRGRGATGEEDANAAVRVVSSHARAVATIGAPVCELVTNLAQLCASFVGTPHESAFGHVFEGGCRCPAVAPSSTTGHPASAADSTARLGSAPSPPPPLTLFVGTHHKTGTVLLEQLMQEAAKAVDGAHFYKPRWADCKPPTQRVAASGTVAQAKLPPSVTLPPLASLGIPTSGPQRVRAFCVDEHVKTLPAAARGSGVHHPGPDGTSAAGSSSPRSASASRAPFVHVIRDPLEVCASSYLYALRSNESWLLQPNPKLPESMSYQAYYRRAPLKEGLAHECRRCIKEMKQMASLYEATRTDPHALTLRFEELVEGGAEGFDAGVRRLLLFAGLGPSTGDVRASARFGRMMQSMRKHDLSRRVVLGRNTATHVSNASQKGALRALLLHDEGVGVAAELQRLRERLHYSSDVEEAASVRRRRWRVAGVLHEGTGAIHGSPRVL